MINALVGTKIGQTQHFTPEGKRIPVTKIVAGPCYITRLITTGAGMRAQLAFGTGKYLTKALEGSIKKAGLEKKPRFLREVTLSGTDESLKEGSQVNAADVFAVGDTVRVVGTGKGKGFAGVVRRHHFRGGPRTHGQSDRERAPGSIGQTTTPGRVYRGKRMAGRLGGDRVTVTGLKVIAVDPENQIVTVSGLVPGGRNALVIVEKEG